MAGSPEYRRANGDRYTLIRDTTSTPMMLESKYNEIASGIRTAIGKSPSVATLLDNYEAASKRPNFNPSEYVKQNPALSTLLKDTGATLENLADVRADTKKPDSLRQGTKFAVQTSNGIPSRPDRIVHTATPEKPNVPAMRVPAKVLSVAPVALQALASVAGFGADMREVSHDFEAINAGRKEQLPQEALEAYKDYAIKARMEEKMSMSMMHGMGTQALIELGKKYNIPPEELAKMQVTDKKLTADELSSRMNNGAIVASADTPPVTSHNAHLEQAANARPQTHMQVAHVETQSRPNAPAPSPSEQGVSLA